MASALLMALRLPHSVAASKPGSRASRPGLNAVVRSEKLFAARISGFRLKISGGNHHQFLWVNVLAQGRVDLVGRERCDLLLEVGLPSHGAVKVPQSRERAGEGGVAGAA